VAGFESLLAQPGEPVLPKWQQLIAWIRRQQVQAPGARVTYAPGGARVLFDEDELRPIIRFAVQLSGKTVTVGDGTINGIVPAVDGVPLTGRVNPPAPPPQIQLPEKGRDNVCLVCIKTTHDTYGALTAATIEARTPESLPGGMRADFLAGQHGFIPIALVRYNPQTSQPESVHQHSVHNLQCRMYQTDAGRRVIYWAAG